MRRIAQTVFAVILTLMVSGICAQGSESTKQPPVPEASVNDQELLVAKQQVKLLQAQLDVTHRYQDSMVNTVYWALGGVFLIASVLVGFGWFANFKVYERDRDAMKSEIQSFLSSKVKDLDIAISAKASELSDGVSTKIESAVENSENSTLIRMEQLSRRIFDIELVKELERVTGADTPSMALTYALSALELCIENDSSELPEIIQIMIQKIDAGGKLTAKEIVRVNRLLDAIQQEYRALSERLRAKISASDIYNMQT